MKNLLVLAFGITSAVLAASSPANAALVTFEDLNLSPNSYYNISPFSSGGASFNNRSEPNYWEGFSYSNMGDTATAGYTNQYSSFAGGGAGGDGIFAVGYMGSYYKVTPTITLPEESDTPLSIEITNTTYAALSMRDGDKFTTKFGGESGDVPDYFLLTISGLDAGGSLLGTVDFYLADYRFADNSQDYIVNAWQTVDLSALGSGVRQLTFTLDSSSRSGEFINTPTYVAIDNIQVVPEPGASLLVALGFVGFAAGRRRRP